jgi:bifunctional NMN adenylyltransferase/nudix hydrolase
MTVGIVVGRFQVEELHYAHLNLLHTAQDMCDHVIVFIGTTEVKNGQRNPLDFETRFKMIHSSGLDMTKFRIFPLPDQSDDQFWYQELDRLIEAYAGDEEIILFGGRDSCFTNYNGKYTNIHNVRHYNYSGTEKRQKIIESVPSTVLHREGVIWAANNRWPTTFTTVDVAIFDHKYDRLLLGKRNSEDKYRLIGGFSDPQSLSFEDDARREAKEEADVTLDAVTYIKSMFIDDWRYRNEKDKVKTILFAAKIDEFDIPRPGDDIDEVRWFGTYPLAAQLKAVVMPLHIPLVEAVLPYAQASNMYLAGQNV